MSLGENGRKGKDKKRAFTRIFLKEEEEQERRGGKRRKER